MKSFHKLATTVIMLMLFTSTEVVALTHPKVPYTASNAIGSRDNQVGADRKNIVDGVTVNVDAQDSHGHKFPRNSAGDPHPTPSLCPHGVCQIISGTASATLTNTPTPSPSPSPYNY